MVEIKKKKMLCASLELFLCVSACLSVVYRPYAKMAAVNFCHREELFVNRNISLHCKDQVKRIHCMKF